MSNNKIETIIINLFSNLIWELILSIPSAYTLAKYLLSHCWDVLNKQNINNTVAFIVFFILIETILFCVIHLIKSCVFKGKNKSKATCIVLENEKDVKKESDIVENDIISADYYFENYTKHVTIYENGNGIIMNTFDIRVNNVENFREFKRKINVEDGNVDIVFPTLSKMKETSKEKRFKDFGFWVYKPKDSIISSTIEKYWSDNDPDEVDHISEHNPKELRWVFEINRSKIDINKTHRISYAISIPGLYPLEKGKFSKVLANEPEQEGKASTSIHVEHYVKKITYIISFANGINLKREPECFTLNGKKIPITDYYIEEGVFYNKYIFTIKKPSYGTNIVIKWEYFGGNAMDKEGGD